MTRKPAERVKCPGCGSMITPQGRALHLTSCKGSTTTVTDPNTQGEVNAIDETTEEKPKRAGGLLSGEGGLLE